MIANEQYQRLSNPQNNVKIMAAWEGFLSGHAPQANALRCLIDDSWRRCLAVQVDPARRQALPPVNEATRENPFLMRNSAIMRERTPWWQYTTVSRVGSNSPTRC